MLEHERAMMVDPLARIMARMEPGTAELIEKWSDPVILLFGFATWGARLWTIAGAGDEPKRKPPEEAPPTPPRSNGKERTEVPPAGPPVDILGKVAAGHAEI